MADRLTEVIHDDWEHSRLLDVDERAVESGEEREFEAQLTKADSMLDFAKRDQITLLVRGDQSVLRDQFRVVSLSRIEAQSLFGYEVLGGGGRPGPRQQS